MTDQSNDNTLRWFQHKEIGIISRPEVRFALPVLLDALGLTPDSTDMTPQATIAKARVPMSDDITPAHKQRIQQELGDKLFRLLGVDAVVMLEMESDNEHAWITTVFKNKDVKSNDNRV